eukprot:437884-Alexandrium_andersonii.AAC.1
MEQWRKGAAPHHHRSATRFVHFGAAQGLRACPPSCTCQLTGTRVRILSDEVDPSGIWGSLKK